MDECQIDINKPQIWFMECTLRTAGQFQKTLRLKVVELFQTCGTGRHDALPGLNHWVLGYRNTKWMWCKFMYIYIYVHTYIHTYTCLYNYEYVYIYIHAFKYVYVYVYIYIHLYLCAIYIYVLYVYIYINVYM